jgi:glycosyltransferase involved in cell wall biosynthesis
MAKHIRTFVISAVNQLDGGTLRIVDDFLKYVDNMEMQSDVKFIALVHTNVKDQMEKNYKSISFKGYKLPKKFWIFRLIFENVYCFFLARKFGVTHWISLHDLTPRLPHSVQSCVYCHNPSPVHKLKWIDILNPKFVLFVLLYKHMYKLNLHRNKFVIVQQEWLKEYFVRSFNFNRVHVLSPEDHHNISSPSHKSLENERKLSKDKVIFIYPCLPRTYKNIEVLIKAFKFINSQKCNIHPHELILTIEKNENSYTRYLTWLAKDAANINFNGRLARSKILEHFSKQAVLLFPSRLETWGLPLSEAKAAGTEIIAADLHYAHETLNGYPNAHFFDVDDYVALSDLVMIAIDKHVNDSKNLSKKTKNMSDFSSPSSKSWQEQILNNLK